MIYFEPKDLRAYWLSSAAIDPNGGYECSRPLADHVPELSDFDVDILHRLFGIDTPVTAFVTAQNNKRRCAHFTSQVLEEEIAGDPFIDLGGGLYLASPELSFLRAARTMDEVELVQFGYELCCWFSSDPGSSDLPERPARTTIAKLREFLSGCKGARGQAKALRALKYVREGVRSPREIALAMILVLPQRLGGYNFHEVQTNVDIKLKPGATYTKRVADIYIPELKRDFEYDGKDGHDGDMNYIKDSVRETELFAVGVDCIGITKVQLRSIQTMNEIALSTAKLLGRQLRFDRYGFYYKQRALWMRLL